MEPKPPARDWVVYALIVANLAAFAYELSAGVDAISPTAPSLVEVGGNFPPLTAHGEWWRLGTAMFLHGGVLHLGLNMLCLWQGRIVERIFGHAGFAAIYLAAGLCGGVASLARGGMTVSVGASGAVFGVYGAFAAFLWLRRATIPAEIWSKTARQMATFVGINLVYGFSQPGIDMSAHVGGIIGGFAAGALLLAGASAQAQRGLRIAVVVIAGVAIAAVGVTTVSTPDDVQPLLQRFEGVEHRAITTFQEIAKAVDAGSISSAAAADRIEHEVLAPWRDVRAEIDAARPADPLAPQFDALRRYMTARQTAWEAYVAVLRAPPDQTAAKLEIFKQASAEANADVQAIKDAGQRRE